MQNQRWNTQRITHSELLTSTGSIIAQQLSHGRYTMVWITTPTDWHIKVPKRLQSRHWERLQAFVAKCLYQKCHVAIFGPPGYLWKQPTLVDILQQHDIKVDRLRLCAFKLQYKSTQAPSGSYLQIATNVPHTFQYRCTCKVPMSSHIMDWIITQTWESGTLPEYGRVCLNMFRI